MNELTLEWIEKAENDYVTAIELYGLRLDATTDAICFHCQQCVEKYTKAYLHHQTVEFPRTHNLAQLLSLCEGQDITFSEILLEIGALNSYGAEIRYPGRFTSMEEAEGAIRAMESVRAFIRSKLGL